MTHSSQPPSDGPRLLWSQIEREVLLFLVELSKVLTRLLVDHGQHSGYRLSGGVAIKSEIRQTISIRPIPSEVCEGERGTNILVNLAADPPAIFCTRRVRRSFLSSANCLVKSFLVLRKDRISQGGIVPTGLGKWMRTLTGVRRP